MLTNLFLLKDLINVFYVSIGAVVGGIVGSHLDNIIISNSIGSYLIGLFMGLSLQGGIRLFLVVGFCGSLTTFSGWIYDFFLMLKNGSIFEAFLYILFILSLGIIFVYLGFFSSRKLTF